MTKRAGVRTFALDVAGQFDFGRTGVERDLRALFFFANWLEGHVLTKSFATSGMNHSCRGSDVRIAE